MNSNIVHMIRSAIGFDTDGSGSVHPGVPALGLAPAVLLHGAGVAGWDEFVIFGGIGLIILALIFMSWRAGRQRKRAGGTRRRSR